ncbi:TRAP transporter small permease [Cetobacterium sp.]|uniref:TRAP transporter small permease n=1 Tax=Cetobacterium sp. TaxID=2071632 RepID=UPI002FC75554
MKKWNIDEMISCFFLTLTIMTVIINITMRYFFNSPLRSAEEFATICFIWSVFVGGAASYRKKMHMGIDILTQLLPNKFQNYITLIVNIIMVVLNGAFSYLSIKFSIASRMKPTAVLGISSSYVNLSLVFGFGFIFIYSSIETIKSFNKIFSKQNKDEKNYIDTKVEVKING